MDAKNVWSDSAEHARARKICGEQIAMWEESNALLVEVGADLLEVARLFREELALCTAMAGPMAEKVGALEDRVNAAIAKAEALTVFAPVEQGR